MQKPHFSLENRKKKSSRFARERVPETLIYTWKPLKFSARFARKTLKFPLRNTQKPKKFSSRFARKISKYIDLPLTIKVALRAKRAEIFTIFTLRNTQKCLQTRHKNDPLVPICPLKYHIKRFSREARRKFSGFRRVNRGICMILSREARRNFFRFLKVNERIFRLKMASNHWKLPPRITENPLPRKSGEGVFGEILNKGGFSMKLGKNLRSSY